MFVATSKYWKIGEDLTSKNGTGFTITLPTSLFSNAVKAGASCRMVISTAIFFLLNDAENPNVGQPLP